MLTVIACMCVCVDEVWLRMLNNERKKESLGEISADLFESIMDRLEKMWFDLVCKCSFFFIVINKRTLYR